MCMKNLFAEKKIFDNFTAFLTWPIFDHCTNRLMGNSAYFVKSTPPRTFSTVFAPLSAQGVKKISETGAY